jgi:hypothetical protein
MLSYRFRRSVVISFAVSRFAGVAKKSLMLRIAVLSAGTKCRARAKSAGLKSFVFRVSMLQPKSILRPGRECVPWRNRPLGLSGVNLRTPPFGAAIAFKVTVQAGAADAENMRRAHAVALAHVEDSLDVDFTNLFE